MMTTQMRVLKPLWTFATVSVNLRLKTTMQEPALLSTASGRSVPAPD